MSKLLFLVISYETCIVVQTTCLPFLLELSFLSDDSIVLETLMEFFYTIGVEVKEVHGHWWPLVNENLEVGVQFFIDNFYMKWRKIERTDGQKLNKSLDRLRGDRVENTLLQSL